METDKGGLTLFGSLGQRLFRIGSVADSLALSKKLVTKRMVTLQSNDGSRHDEVKRIDDGREVAVKLGIERNFSPTL
jgi:hypothetical protein